MTATPSPAEPRTVVNGSLGAAIDARDRGFTLGDGVFETMRVTDGRIARRRHHFDRLHGGCQALGFDAPAESVLADDCALAIGQGGDGVLRLTVSRGLGPRGYAPPQDPEPTRVAAFQPGLPSFRPDGLTLRWCSMRLACQPRLAGWKHLNRLEQVMARSEWDDPALDEGVMCSVDERVIECTSSNLFWVCGSQVITPSLHDCGVAGVMRARVIERAHALGWDVVVRDAAPAEPTQADEVFITSAVRGIAAVRALGSTTFDPPGPVTRALIDDARERP